MSQEPRGATDGEVKAFHEWWATQGMQGEENAMMRWSAWNGWLACAQASRSESVENVPCRLNEAVGFLMQAADLMGGSHASTMFEDQCGHLAEQINAFIGTIHPLECGPLAACSPRSAIASHQSVWEVENKTTRILFSTKESAQSFINTFPASVAGGMQLRQVGVV